MTYDQITLKDKAKNLALAVVILQAASLLFSYILFLSQKAVFKFYFSFSDADRYHVSLGNFMFSRIGAILVMVFYVIYFLVVSNTVSSLKSKGILFTVINLVLSIVVLSVVSYISQIFIGRLYGAYELGAYAALTNIISIFTSPLTVVATALFFISCGFLIASDHINANMANYMNSANVTGTAVSANTTNSANNTNI